MYSFLTLMTRISHSLPYQYAWTKVFGISSFIRSSTRADVIDCTFLLKPKFDCAIEEPAKSISKS